MTIDYHIPVMLEECLHGLDISPRGTYVDATFGGGGHSRAILSQLDKGILVGFDRDMDARSNTPRDDRFMFVNHDFTYIKNYLKYLDLVPVDGLLADLGVSSHQFDTAERGFSYRYDAPLDMRMDQSIETTAADILNTYTALELQEIFGKYGEIRNARQLANRITEERKLRSIIHTKQLAGIAEKVARKKDKTKQYVSQVFQALRIAVNNELEAVQALLDQSSDVIREGGRLVVITYHSLEDRLVKNFINHGNFTGEIEKDIYGRESTPFRPVGRKPFKPSSEETETNPRSRSARLRVAEKIRQDA